MTEEAVLKAAKTVRKVKLSEQDDNNDAVKGGKRVNINEVGGDIMYELDSMHNYLHWASMVWLLSLFI